MKPTSPKGKDLQPDDRYTLHCSVEDSSGGEGEFYVRWRAILTDEALIRAQAVQASPYGAQDRYILLMLTIEFAFINAYIGGEPSPRRWQSQE